MNTGRVSLLALALATVAGCAGYQIGNRTLFPQDIETIHVPVFKSSSLRRDLGERLTEAVCKEIGKRTPYRLTGDPNADSVLEGQITSETKHLLLQNRRGDPRNSELGLQVMVTWRSRRGGVIRDCPPVPIPDNLVAVGATGDLVPETGQSVATSQQVAIQRLAEQIVSLMEAPW